MHVAERLSEDPLCKSHYGAQFTWLALGLSLLAQVGCQAPPPASLPAPGVAGIRGALSEGATGPLTVSQPRSPQAKPPNQTAVFLQTQASWTLPSDLKRRVDPLIARHAHVRAQWMSENLVATTAYLQGLLTALPAQALPSPSSPWAHRLSQLGLSPRHPAAESCAVYVRDRLSPQAVAEWTALGVFVNPDVWVPPVPSHGHAYGFQQMIVPYHVLAAVARRPEVVRILSLETPLRPKNDLGRASLHVDDVHNGQGVTATTGVGVKVCIADSGLDLTHPDMPKPVEAYDITSGDSLSQWSTNVVDTVSGHGTHVVGTALGSGAASAGKYKGMAPGASLYFYKIGNNVDGSSSAQGELMALQRAVDVGCQIFSMSYGLMGMDVDGSDPMSQAIDAAVQSGVNVFIAAGNEADAKGHAYVDLGPGESTVIEVTVSGEYSDKALVQNTILRANWRDAVPADGNISIGSVDFSDTGESFYAFDSFTTSRNTEFRDTEFTASVGAGSKKTYQFTVSNAAAAAKTRVHLYLIGGEYWVNYFVQADPSQTIGSPAIADSAIAVAAWTDRVKWYNYQGKKSDAGGDKVGAIASFSSLGPRIDGRQKPELAAIGQAVISTRDSAANMDVMSIIDDDGLNLDGSGPAHYVVMQGTSMATPMAAGAAALVLGAHPNLTPAQLRARLEQTASLATKPDSTIGYGLLDAKAAINLPCQASTCVGDFPGQCTTSQADGCGGTIDCSNACSWSPCVAGSCAPPSSVCTICKTNLDCAANQDCGTADANAEYGVCLPSCADGQACPGGTTCQGNPGTCAFDKSKTTGTCAVNVAVTHHGCGVTTEVQCGGNEACKDGTCVCIPSCFAKVCGNDGCGGSCGSCPTGQACEQNQCVPAICKSLKTLTCASDITWDAANLVTTDRIDAWACAATGSVNAVGAEFAFDVLDVCPGTVEVNLQHTGNSIPLHLLAIDAAQPCTDSACTDSVDVKKQTATLTRDGQTGQTLRYVVDSDKGHSGSYHLTVACVCSAEGSCSNHQDEDQDGLTDCNDSDCDTAAICAVCGDGRCTGAEATAQCCGDCGCSGGLVCAADGMCIPPVVAPAASSSAKNSSGCAASPHCSTVLPWAVWALALGGLWWQKRRRART